jgi:hypothetical protein
MNILAIAASIGALQGGVILLSILLKFRHRKNLPLALLLTVFSFRLATIPTWNMELLLRYPWLFPLTTPLPFLFGPLLWWYIREFASDKLNTPKPLIVHFIPYIFETAAVVFTILMMDTAEYQQFLYRVFSGDPPVWLPVRNGLKVILNAVYIFISCRFAFSKRSGQLSAAKRLWIRSLVIIPSLVLVCFTYVAVLPGATERLSGGSSIPFFILAFAMIILIYGISFLFMIAPDVSFFKSRIKKGEDEPLCSDEECRRLVEKLEKHLSEGAFQNPDLVLGDLASGLKIFEAGFPTKSTFNRVFKEKTGMTPSVYVKKLDA